jgi:hypothetical protein
MTKTTKRDNFTSIIAVLKDAGKDDLVAVMEHEIELLDKKSANRSTKPTVRQAENAEIKSAIVASFEKGKLYRCSEIQAMNEILASATGTQRTARLCNDLVGEGLLVKSIDKKVVYFALAE